MFLFLTILELHTLSLIKHIMSTEKMRKDTRGTKDTYYNDCYLIFLVVKSRLGIFPQLLTVFFLLYL